ncbi:MAG TPA: GNAT family N-acetyltransferase [Egibacteraceae bacterium]|nr:GNAT family N-acetyltransferase [Egibacteraceae bacterium]HVM14605.1 GNAT family N-acetyltransferase [Egibacteraceae bacterium]HVM21404.1 GNAT family N-acetyltransferase [Egibacteraceae bacterium]
MHDLVVRPESMDGPVAQRLLAELDVELHERYGGGGDPVRADAADFAPPEGLFLVAWVDGQAEGCAGFRRLDDATAELKRMYVRPERRGTGLARALLAAVEECAVASGYRRMWLETGLPQPEAMALYRASGYEPIASFGQYADSPSQRCFGKALPVT